MTYAEIFQSLEAADSNNAIMKLVSWFIWQGIDYLSSIQAACSC